MISSRRFRLEDDFDAVRQFLIDTYPRFDRLFNWGIDRWDVHRYSGRAAGELSGDHGWTRWVRIWEDQGRIVGVVNPEGDDDVHLQIDPDYRDLERSMLAWVEANWSTDHAVTWAREDDDLRRRVLRERGWADEGRDGFTRRRSLQTPLPAGPVAAGYTVRAIELDSPTDAANRAAISRAVFGSKRTAETAAVLRHAPTYRPDLDLVAVAADGSFAANTTVWLDTENAYVIFEPVGTHPDHRRRGLASAAMVEGMRRAVALGAVRAYVGSGLDAGANALYEGLGFVDADAHVRYRYRRG